MTCPSTFSNAPPLFPGLMAASVWISPLVTVSPDVSSSKVTPRFNALITPVVTDWPYPNALPIAIAVSPTLMESESPTVATLIAFMVSEEISDNFTATTAKSLDESVPFTSALTVWSS